jgi:dienelactone hydrolase
MPRLSLHPPALLTGLVLLLLTRLATSADWQLPEATPGDQQLAEYFAAQTAALAGNHSEYESEGDDDKSLKEKSRAQLLEMLGLDPLPEKTDLKPVVTGTLEHGDVVVEKLHFQSRPGLYVTANLYRPKNIEKRLPAILYVCGHGQVKHGGISYGNKVHYQHHGYWFAQHGYVCLVIDTLQLGEIEGIHHGTYKYDMWWWLNRGYTPAGVEAWNCVRALDYLQSRPDVDGEKLGVTGRSGGGAYSWWIAAIDERIKCAVPTAGITDLKNHVVDGCVEGHCDCMYMVNTYRWDYSRVAALVAPRPLLITNTDSDPIFPLDGVVRLFEQVRKTYKREKAAESLGLNITAGGHVDTQEQQVHTLRWFNRHLKGEEPLITDAAEKHFTPEQLRVFSELPQDEINTKIHETFVAAAPRPEIPADKAAWNKTKQRVTHDLDLKVFRAWPADSSGIEVKHVGKHATNKMVVHQYVHSVPFEYYYSHIYTPIGDEGPPQLVAASRVDLERAERVVLHVIDDSNWKKVNTWWPAAFRGTSTFGGAAKEAPTEEAIDWAIWPKLSDDDPRQSSTLHLFVAPRCVGPFALSGSEAKMTQIHRRFYLLGQTLEGMQVWDVRRAIQAVRVGLPDASIAKDAPIEIQASGRMAGVALYASLFEPPVAKLTLTDLPPTHRDGPYFLNVSRILEMPQAVALAAERGPVVLRNASEADWEYPLTVAKKLGWSDHVIIEPAE